MKFYFLLKSQNSCHFASSPVVSSITRRFCVFILCSRLITIPVFIIVVSDSKFLLLPQLAALLCLLFLSGSCLVWMLLFLGFSVQLAHCETGPKICNEIIPGSPNCLVGYMDFFYFIENTRQFYFSIKQNSSGELAVWSSSRLLPSMCETLD